LKKYKLQQKAWTFTTGDEM